MKIHKQACPNPEDSIIVDDCGRVLHVDSGFFWFEVSPGKSLELTAVGTGWDAAESWDYTGTWFAGPFVWHLMARKK